MLDVFHVSRCAVVLAQFGRFGSEVDDVVRVLIERLKDNLATNDVEQNAVCKVYAKGVKEVRGIFGGVFVLLSYHISI